MVAREQIEADLGAESRSRFSLRGMLQYTAVMAVLLALPPLIGRTDNPLIGASYDLLFCSWCAYGVWVVLGRRKLVLALLIGCMAIVFIPLLLANVERLVLGTRYVERLYYAIGLERLID